MTENSNNTSNHRSAWTKDYLEALNKKIAEAKFLQKQVNEKKPVIKDIGNKKTPEKKTAETISKKQGKSGKDHGVRHGQQSPTDKNRKPPRQEQKNQERNQQQKNKVPKARTVGGNITGMEPLYFYVLSGNAEYRCKTATPLNLREPLLVGDRVHIRVISGREGVIEKVDSRQNTAVNPGTRDHKQEYTVAANINQIVIIVSAKEPVLRTDWLDRHLVLCERKGYKPVICCTKIDLAEDNLFIEQLDVYKKLGYKILFTTTVVPSNVAELKQMLRNKITLIVGHAGVGKTALINNLRKKNDRSLPVDPETQDWSLTDEYEETKTVRAYYIDGGGMVIDTPGIQEYELTGISKKDLKKYFREFRAFNPHCSNPSCIHMDEAFCAVRRAVTTSEISQDRYDSYLRILESLSA